MQCHFKEASGTSNLWMFHGTKLNENHRSRAPNLSVENYGSVKPYQTGEGDLGL